MTIQYNTFKSDSDAVFDEIGQDKCVELLSRMLNIRNFEMRAESAYQQGKVGGFFHAYIGQEAIQTAAVEVIGKESYWTTTYRCHALALLLGVTPEEAMAEFYGKQTGNALGRGGSMHLFSDTMLGGHGIVGGQVPIGTGAGFKLKYKEQKAVSVTFMGDGAVVQGSFHESLNLASLWSLPCIYVIENNQWGMGTAVKRAVCKEPIAESQAPSYGMKAYSLDGMDLFNCYAGFKHIYNEVLETSRPVLVEVVTQRYRGHSISDPAVYRSKEELECAKANDSILKLKAFLIEKGALTEEHFKELSKESVDRAKAAMEYAEKSPDPDPVTLGEDVFAPSGGENG